MQQNVRILGMVSVLEYAERAALNDLLVEAFKPYSRRKLRAVMSIEKLQAFLSLPIWQKRHELYAVWIATEMIAALDDHECQIHHRDGTITFSFKETLVATVISTDPEFRLISERWVKLENPVGQGRVRGAQPDFGLWRGDVGLDRCKMIVEVKHYKRSANKKFADTLNDYAHAFTDAKIWLVNHGSISNIDDQLDKDVQHRCTTLASLTPDNLFARKKLAEAVRSCVGEPIPCRSTGESAEPVFAIDVSGSMLDAIRDTGLNDKLLDEIPNTFKCIALIDDEFRGFVSRGDLLAKLETLGRNATSLADPIEYLFIHYLCIFLMTDADGLAQLERFDPQLAKAGDDSKIKVVKIVRR